MIYGHTVASEAGESEMTRERGAWVFRPIVKYLSARRKPRVLAYE